MGEFLVQLMSYLNSAPGETGTAQDVAASTLGFPVWMHRKLDGETADATPATDELGFSAAYDHRFTLDLERGWLDDASEGSQSTQGVALSAQLVSMPDFLQPVTMSVWFAQGNFSRGLVQLSWDGADLAETKVVFDSVLTGYYTQYHAGGTTGLLLGLGTGLEFIDRDTIARPDQIALAHLTGPVAGVFYSAGGFDLRTVARLQGDFATIRSLAFRRVRQEYPDDVFKSSLQERQYQFHLGISTRLSVAAQLGPARLTFEHGFGEYASIDGLDRFQERITRDPEGRETLSERRLELAIEPSGLPWRFYAGIERLSHESRLAATAGGRLERRLLAGVGLQL
jgi:hypothetical protein